MSKSSFLIPVFNRMYSSAFENKNIPYTRNNNERTRFIAYKNIITFVRTKVPLDIYSNA